jgi:hypothetical protein
MAAKTVAEYLKGLPEEKRKALAAVRKVIRANLPKGYSESLGYGGITYAIPLSKYPNTYNKQPLCYIALAAQKNFNTLYLMSAYGSTDHLKKLQDGYKKAGKKLDMGKSCIHFRSPDDLELEVIGKLVSSVPPEKWIQIYEKSRK